MMDYFLQKYGVFMKIVLNTEGVNDFGLGISDFGTPSPTSDIPNPKYTEGVNVSDFRDSLNALYKTML